MNYQAHLGDSLEILKTLPSNSVDSLVTDPPAGIGLCNLEWDKDKGGKDEWIKWLSSIMRECHRVLRPGAHGFVWAIPRTSHWTASALEDAGFHVKDVVTHVFGSGFPKSIAIDKAMDRAKYADTDLVYRVTTWIRGRRDELGLTNRQLDEAAGIKGGASHWTAQPPGGQPHIPTKERWAGLETLLGPAPDWLLELIRPAHELGENWKDREIVGLYTKDSGGAGNQRFRATNKEITLATDKDSKKWVGWGTALKPASEHWILIQKPISEHNIAANIRKHGVGGINIDRSRIPVHGRIPSTTNLDFRDGEFLWDNSGRSRSSVYHQHPQGRFPANFLVTRAHKESCPAKLLNEQSERCDADVASYFQNFKPESVAFYAKKAGKMERGLDNTHPTVKPLRLMRYLTRMVTPEGGVVLDPFMGSGTTGVACLFDGFKFIGIEADEAFFRIASKRLQGVKKND